MRARLKPEIWDVWQHKGSNIRPLWVLNVTELHDGVLFLRRGNALKVPIDQGNWLVRAGDQIENESDADFRRDYEVVE
jgi:hypothetical protein